MERKYCHGAAHHCPIVKYFPRTSYHQYHSLSAILLGKKKSCTNFCCAAFCCGSCICSDFFASASCTSLKYRSSVVGAKSSTRIVFAMRRQWTFLHGVFSSLK